MTFCGYHPEMESGLNTFGKGLAKAIRSRHERLGESMETIADLEQSEMNELCSALSSLAGGPRKVALEGLSNFVKGVFAAAAGRIRHGEKVPFDVAVEQEASVISSLIQPMEDEAKTLSASGASDPMRQLANWVAAQ